MPKPSVQQLKGMQRFKLGMWKGLPFFNRRYTKGASSSPGRFSLGLEVGPRPQSQGKALWGRGWKGYLLWQKGWEGGPRGRASPYKALLSTPRDFTFLAVFLPSPPFLRLTRQVDDYNCSFVNSPTVEKVGLNVTIGSTSNDWQETRKKLTNCRFLLDKKLIAFKLETSWLH